MKIQHTTDGYKLGHIEQYIKGTTCVSSNMTPRDDRLAEVITKTGKVVFFGLQYVVKNMVSRWENDFFSQPKDQVIKAYSRRIKNYLSPSAGDIQITAMAELHDFGCLPIHIKALPEGSMVDMRVPFFTVKNTNDRFYWLTNYIETYLSANIWPMCNAASVAQQYFLTSKRWARLTAAPDHWLPIANHCFAARGMRGDQDSMTSGAAHLLFGVGSDTLWSIDFLEEYYGADSDKELIACSVNAFEHATATQRIAYFGSEYEAVKDAITNIYPKGIISYVGDSDDYFRFISSDMLKLKDAILARTEDDLGLCKFVVRPDSSPKTPLEIICGDVSAKENSQEFKGTLNILWNIFGGTYNDLGYKVINPKVGMIYGEAINLKMQNNIYARMESDGWCVSNVLFGVGSWGYIKNSSRDSYGMAIKGTHSIVNGEPLSMQKNPKTSSNFKKSAKGLLRVEKVGENYVLHDCQTEEQEKLGELKTVSLDGKILNLQTLSEIRKRAQSYTG